MYDSSGQDTCDEHAADEPTVPARRREAWRARREAMETAPAGRCWRGRVRHHLYGTAKVVIRLLGPTRVFRRVAANAVEIDVTEVELAFPDIPARFDGYRILHLTDLHLDNMDEFARATEERIAPLEADLCVITGDIRDNIRSPMAVVLDRLKYVLGSVTAADGILGILGNHDSAAMVEPLEELGVRMLINETITIRRGSDRLHVTGLDDVHRFHTEAAAEALDATPEGFGIALVHSPEIADRAATRHRLYLCGHTHGGQVCLPGGRPLVNGLKRHRDLAVGLWRHGDMVGYTSRGIGVCLFPVRLNSPGEVALVTLRRGPQSARVRDS